MWLNSTTDLTICWRSIFLVKKNPQNLKKKMPILIRNDMTNFVYSCKPTQHQLWCISLDPESNFSFLIIYCIDTNQFCQEIIWWSINSIKKKWFSFLVKMMASQIIKFTKVQCIEWLISPPLDHILDLNSFAWTKSFWIVKKILQLWAFYGYGLLED